jgi:peptidoglycan/xylan/chitin deacetylase (PgdA/CDA1 family)
VSVSADGNVFSPSQQTSFTTTDTTQNFTGLVKNWGLSFTPASFNGNLFKVKITSTAGTLFKKANVSDLTVTVSYTTASSTTASPQTITVTAHATSTAVYGATFPVSATASSGLPVSITTTGVCAIASNTVTMTSATSTCITHYNQSGNSAFSPAPEITETTQSASRPISIKASDVTKPAGTNDPVLTYTVTSGSIATPDQVTGSLSRVAGETTGTLTLGPNYTIAFTPGTFTITPVTVTTGTVKTLVAVSGGSATANNFTISVSGASATPNSFAGSSAGTLVTVNGGQTYTITASAVSNYTATPSTGCAGTVAAGGTATCTITETFSGTNTSNLIANPSLETANGSLPDQWSQGSWGNNNAVFTYPFTAPSSDLTTGVAVNITITNYTDGDAKWFFTPVQVTDNERYIYTDAYISTVPTQTLAEYFDANHNHLSYDPGSNGWSGLLPATPANTWKVSSNTFSVPAGAVYMTVFHILSGAGNLTTDSYSLSLVPPPSPFANGFVSLSFDDGFIDHSSIVKPILIAQGVKSTFYIISHTAGFAVANSSLETPDSANPSQPLGWTTSGNSNATYSYPVSGHTGNAVSVSSNQNNTDASWNFTPVSIFADENYTYADYYTGAPSAVYVIITTTNNTTEYIDATGAVSLSKTPLASLASTTNWTAFSGSFYLPPEAKTVTVMHTLKSVGSLSIDDIDFGAYHDFMTPAQVLDLQSSGLEVGGHTQTHIDLSKASIAQAIDEIGGGRQDLLTSHVTPMLSLAYPYGAYNQTIEQLAQNAGYTSARTVIPGWNGKNTDKFGLLSQSVNKDTTIAQIESWIDQAVADKTWLILTYHQVENQSVLDANNLTYGSTPENLTTIINYLKSHAVPIKTVSEGVSLMN